MLTAIVFILIIGVLIFVHELGHFVVAKRNGIKAEEFGFGFPPRIAGIFKKNGKFRISFGNKNIEAEDTVYSINSIPLGGFVKIKGENGENSDEDDSFASKKAWIRFRVLAAGVTMNLLLAWFLVSLSLMIGAPQPVDSIKGSASDFKIQVAEVSSGSPAELAGIQVGDEIKKCVDDTEKTCLNNFSSVSQVQEFTLNNEKKEISLLIVRGSKEFLVNVIPRNDFPDGQGPVGVSLVHTAIEKLPFYKAIGKGFIITGGLILSIIIAFYEIIRNIFINSGATVDVAGPIGIAILTKQVTELGLVYIFQFTALLSINLAIINGLPFPALDGGRIFFIIIEKIKGSPVSRKIENVFHVAGFILLILLMIFVTFKDIIRLNIWGS